MLEVMNYYEVIAKCGHVGRNKYVPIKFGIMAESGKEAARIVRQFPRVKHDHKDAILKVTKIDYERYLEIFEVNANDPYLKCYSKHQQKQIENLEERLLDDNHNKKKSYNKQERIDRVSFKARKYKVIEKLCWEEKYEYAC